MGAPGFLPAIAIALLGVASLVVAMRLRWWHRHFSLQEAWRQQHPRYWRQLQRARWGVPVLALALFCTATGLAVRQQQESRQAFQTMQSRLKLAFDKNNIWQAPDWSLLALHPQQDLVKYGRDLVAHTTDYFGEQGLLRPNSSNGLNCQNCHLEAGSKPFGNNYAGVAANYPKMRARSGKSEDIPYRINDCFQRSLNGLPLDTNSREMRAIVAYITWLGANVPVKAQPKGVGLLEVPFLDRPADPARGVVVYGQHCARCHGQDGQGLPMPESPRTYPPLWGEHSYAESAGLFRLSRLAGYVQANMPYGINYLNPVLSAAEAWDVAAYINSQPRPAHRFLADDWPEVAKKTFDHPFGPYADTFSEHQHKFGPFQPIVDFYKVKAAASASSRF